MMPVARLEPPEELDYYADDFEEDFEPEFGDVFDHDYQPPAPPWYHSTSAVLATGAIGAAVIAILVSAVLLVSRGVGRTPDPPTDVVQPSISTGTPSRSQDPATIATNPPSASDMSSPPAIPSASAITQHTPQAPAPTRAPATRVNNGPQTRPPDISVRPTHRPAFPNQ
jgi:hypothetical protein